MSKRSIGRKARKVADVSQSRNKATRKEVSKVAKRISRANKDTEKSIKKTKKVLRDSLGRFASKPVPKRGKDVSSKKSVVNSDRKQTRKTKASGKAKAIPAKPKTQKKAAVSKSATTKQAVKKSIKKATKAGRETKKQTKQVAKSTRAAKKFVKAIVKSKKSKTKKRTSKQKASKPPAKTAGNKVGKRGSGKKPTRQQRQTKQKTKQKQTSSKPPKQAKRFTSSRPRVAERETFDTSHLSVVRSYQIRALPDESRRALYGTLEDLKKDAPRLQSLLKDGDYWGFRLNGGNSYQLFDTVQDLIKRLSEYTLYQQFAKNRSKDYREVFNTLELVVVRFNAEIPPPVPNTRIQAQREWQANKVGELKQRKQRVREEKKERRREVREAKRAAKEATKARDKFEAKLKRQVERARKSEEKARLEAARRKAAEDRLRKLTKHKKGGK